MQKYNFAPTGAVALEFYVSIDGTGVPMVPPELAGRAGKGADGQAKTWEVKLAAFYTRTKVDAEGRPVRDPDSTTYLASFASSDEFGPLARHTALQRGLDQAPRTILFGRWRGLDLGNRPDVLSLGRSNLGLLPCQRAYCGVGASCAYRSRDGPATGRCAAKASFTMS